MLILESTRTIVEINIMLESKIMRRGPNGRLTDHNISQPTVRGHSTETALLKVYFDLTDVIDRGDVVLLGLLDMSVAFYTVDYDILLEWLSSTHGIDGLAHQWIKSYLSDRSQTVVVNDIRTATQALTRGVPQ